jgi:hypothetical protein
VTGQGKDPLNRADGYVEHPLNRADGIVEDPKIRRIEVRRISLQGWRDRALRGRVAQ